MRFLSIVALWALWIPMGSFIADTIASIYPSRLMFLRTHHFLATWLFASLVGIIILIVAARIRVPQAPILPVVVCGIALCAWYPTWASYRFWDAKYHLIRSSDGREGCAGPHGFPTLPAVYDAGSLSCPNEQYSALLSEHVIPVRRDAKWGLLGSSFRVITEPQFDALGSPAEDLIPAMKNAKWGFISIRSGKLVIPFDYDDAAHSRFSASSEFSGSPISLAPVRRGEKWGYIDAANGVVIPFEFDEVANFGFKKLTFVRVGGLWGIINSSGNYVVDLSMPFSPGISRPVPYPEASEQLLSRPDLGRTTWLAGPAGFAISECKENQHQCTLLTEDDKITVAKDTKWTRCVNPRKSEQASEFWVANGSCPQASDGGSDRSHEE